MKLYFVFHNHRVFGYKNRKEDKEEEMKQQPLRGREEEGGEEKEGDGEGRKIEKFEKKMTLKGCLQPLTRYQNLCAVGKE